MTSLTCSFCNHANPAGANFCTECGSGLGLRPCEHCDAINDVGAKYCHHCGTLLNERVAASVGGAAQSSRAADAASESSVVRALGAVAPEPAGPRTGSPPSVKELSSAAERLDAFWRDSMQAVEVSRTMKPAAAESPSARPVETLPLSVDGESPVIDVAFLTAAMVAAARARRARIRRAGRCSGGGLYGYEQSTPGRSALGNVRADRRCRHRRNSPAAQQPASTVTEEPPTPVTPPTTAASPEAAAASIDGVRHGSGDAIVRRGDGVGGRTSRFHRAGAAAGHACSVAGSSGSGCSNGACRRGEAAGRASPDGQHPAAPPGASTRKDRSAPTAGGNAQPRVIAATAVACGSRTWRRHRFPVIHAPTASRRSDSAGLACPRPASNRRSARRDGTDRLHDTRSRAAAAFKIVTAFERGTYIQIGQARYIAPLSDIQLDAPPSAGSAENVRRLRYEPGVKLALAAVRRLPGVPRPGRRGHAQARDLIEPLRVVMPLYNEEIYFVVRADSPLNYVHDIRGLRISAGPVGSGTALTTTTLCKLMFNEPIADANATFQSNEDGLAKLVTDRSVDVVAIIAGQPAKVLTDMKPESKVREAAALRSQRCIEPGGIALFPGCRAAASYPSLLTEDLPSLAVKAYLVTYDFNLGSAIICALCTFDVPQFLHPSTNGHPTWRGRHRAARSRSRVALLRADVKRDQRASPRDRVRRRLVVAEPPSASCSQQERVLGLPLAVSISSASADARRT